MTGFDPSIVPTHGRRSHYQSITRNAAIPANGHKNTGTPNIQHLFNTTPHANTPAMAVNHISTPTLATPTVNTPTLFSPTRSDPLRDLVLSRRLYKYTSVLDITNIPKRRAFKPVPDFLEFQKKRGAKNKTDKAKANKKKRVQETCNVNYLTH